jgi:hypothetical protein
MDTLISIALLGYGANQYRIRGLSNLSDNKTFEFFVNRKHATVKEGIYSLTPDGDECRNYWNAILRELNLENVVRSAFHARSPFRYTKRCEEMTKDRLKEKRLDKMIFYPKASHQEYFLIYRDLLRATISKKNHSYYQIFSDMELSYTKQFKPLCELAEDNGHVKIIREKPMKLIIEELGFDTITILDWFLSEFNLADLCPTKITS